MHPASYFLQQSPLDRLRVISVRAHELTNRVEVLQPILNSNYGKQDAKAIQPEVKRDFPSLYAEMADIADSLERVEL